MLVYHNLCLDEVCLHIFHFWISLLIDLHSATNVFKHLMIFHRFPTHSAKDVVLCSFSSKFSPIERMAEGLVKCPLSAMDIMAPCTGTFHRGNSTFLEQSLDFWRQCGAVVMANVCQHSLWQLHSEREIHGFEQRPAFPSLLNHPGSFLTMFFKYKPVSPFLQPPNFVRLSSFTLGLLQGLPGTSYCL